MSGVLKFFLNAIKAILLSPFYLVIFALYLINGFISFLFNEIIFVLSGFRFASKKENKYQKQVQKKRESVGDIV